MTPQDHKTIISVMLAAPDAPAAVEWYKKALAAQLLWSLGSVADLEIEGAPFFLQDPVKNTFESPKVLGTTTARIELFTDKTDEIIARALKTGAADSLKDIRDYEVSWGIHRQGGFKDPFRHVWLVGDNPL